MDPIYHYEVNLNWQSDRKGVINAPGLPAAIEVATPPEFPKGMPGLWSPEHLLVAAVNSCFMTTFLAIAENSKLAFTSLSCPASGKLEKVEGKFMITEVELSPLLTISKNADTALALKVLHKSETACLISNSIKSKIVFAPTIHAVQSVVTTEGSL